MPSPLIAFAASIAAGVIRDGVAGDAAIAGGGAGSGAVCGPSSVGLSGWQAASEPSTHASNTSAADRERETTLPPRARRSSDRVSANDMQAQPFRAERGLVLVLDLDRHVDLH